METDSLVDQGRYWHGDTDCKPPLNSDWTHKRNVLGLIVRELLLPCLEYDPVITARRYGDVLGIVLILE